MQKLKLMFLGVILILVCSCKITNNLWSGGYKELMSSFITTKDGREVAFIGQNYHYLFPDDSGIIKRILFWRQRSILYIDAKQTYLKVDAENNVTGYVIVKSIFADLKPGDEGYLQSLGFVRQENGDMALKLNLMGKRYLANNKNYRTLPLNKSYNLTIHYDKKNDIFTTIGKAALSPITITLDAIIWVGNNIITIPIQE